MSELPQTVKSSDTCQILTSIPEKFVVDFANGIDVGRDHHRVQKERTGFVARLYDDLTGKAVRRQNEINANLLDGVEASLKWLTELTNSLANSNLAIAKVNDRVNTLKLNVAKIANFSADTRQQLESLAVHLDKRCNSLELEISRIDFVQRVQINLEQVFNKWRAGRYSSFSLSGRCYAAIEELRWGAFGDYCRSNTGKIRNDFLSDLSNRAIAQLASDADCRPDTRMGTLSWLEQPKGLNLLPDAQEALAYMGDWFKEEETPFAFTISQTPKQLHLNIPRLCSAERITETLVSEIFEEGAYA